MIIAETEVVRKLRVRLSVLDSIEALTVELHKAKSWVAYAREIGGLATYDEFFKVIVQLQALKIIDCHINQSPHDPWNNQIEFKKIRIGELRKYIRKTQTELNKRTGNFQPTVSKQTASKSQASPPMKSIWKSQHPIVRDVVVGALALIIGTLVLVKLHIIH